MLKDISEYPPGDYGGCYCCYCRGMCGYAPQAGPLQAGAAFYKQIENGDWYCEEDKGVVVPCFGDIAVEHGMECALRAASRAVVAADGAQDAARSVAGGVGRIEVTVEKNKRCHSTCYCKCGGSGFKMFFQLPVHRRVALSRHEYAHKHHREESQCDGGHDKPCRPLRGFTGIGMASGVPGRDNAYRRNQCTDAQRRAAADGQKYGPAYVGGRAFGGCCG